MKNILIISPYFPPSNAADMHRIRMSLPYFRKYGWNAEIVTVDSKYSEAVQDELLTQTIPHDIKIHTVNAFSTKWTRKIGLGSLALRSMWFYFKYVNNLLKTSSYDLIYFSTTQFPICILGACWKKKFKIPYVIDMQDPWHTDYYLSKKKEDRPKKFWFSYYLNKFLEPIAMKSVDGLISVTQSYIDELQKRYAHVKSIPTETITFGYFQEDLEIARTANIKSIVKPSSTKISVVYVGVVGSIMKNSLKILFEALKNIKLSSPEFYNKIEFYFIGTSYAPKGLGKKSVIPIAEQYHVSNNVFEQTDRIDYFSAIKNILNADALFIPGSEDSNYTASKIFPYILAKKKLLALFSINSSTYRIIEQTNAGKLGKLENYVESVKIAEEFLLNLANTEETSNTNWNSFSKYSADSLTKKQCDFFFKILSN